jgi:hypothetical protein
MKSITDLINEKKDQSIDEGISINDFKKLMYKVGSQGVNLNAISATNLMFYFYRNMGKDEFKAVSDKLEEIDSEEIENIEKKNLDKEK